MRTPWSATAAVRTRAAHPTVVGSDWPLGPTASLFAAIYFNCVLCQSLPQRLRKPASYGACWAVEQPSAANVSSPFGSEQRAWRTRGTVTGREAIARQRRTHSPIVLPRGRPALHPISHRGGAPLRLQAGRASDHRLARAPSHLLLASRHEGRRAEGDSGARRTFDRKFSGEGGMTSRCSAPLAGRLRSSGPRVHVSCGGSRRGFVPSRRDTARCEPSVRLPVHLIGVAPTVQCSLAPRAARFLPPLGLVRVRARVRGARNGGGRRFRASCARALLRR